MFGRNRIPWEACSFEVCGIPRGVDAYKSNKLEREVLEASEKSDGQWSTSAGMRFCGGATLNCYSLRVTSSGGHLAELQSIYSDQTA